MTGKYGPNTALVVALLDRVAALTPDEVERFNDARYDAEDDERAAAWYAACDAAEVAERDATWDAAWGDVWDAAVALDAAWDAAWCAAVALVVCDLVGQYGLEQHHIDTLLAPWIAVCGDPRPQPKEETSCNHSH